MARAVYGLHKQAKVLVQASTSATILPSATASYYAVINYLVLGWNGASVGAPWKIKEVDASATASLSNTVQTGYFTATYGATHFNFGEEGGARASTLGSSYKITCETSGSVWAIGVGVHSPTQT